MSEKEHIDIPEEEVTAAEEEKTQEVIVEDEQTAAEPEPVDELAQTKELLLRTAAEYDNFRKRTAKEKSGYFATGAISAISTLLVVLDDLERASAADSTDTEYKKGVELTVQKFHEQLKKLDVSVIDPQGEPFDARYHNAVMQSDEGESGTVTQVLQKGYKMGDTVIRHAMVAVCK